MTSKALTLITLGLLLWPRAARAEPGVQSYALVVGSNRGGEGQRELAFAQRDADNFAALLRELGRTPADHIERLEDPSARSIEHALARLREKLSAHAAAGERSQLIFYYSGHARAKALSLGDEELSLDKLRASLTALPSTLTVVVLDACQSGAFSGVKGASPAADFSVQSVHDLNSSGIAVMASSTGSELSQESRELGSSYFTHHLLASLRGAGDRDRNGRVSLDEAYAYAYQHTLADTARTQVGSQHATLETALTGRGDVPLSYPVDADAQLALSGSIEGKILVQQTGAGAVMAELYKAEGAPLLIALPSGRFEVLVRQENEARSCDVTLARGAVFSLMLEQCKVVKLPLDRAKQMSLQAQAERAGAESWFLEMGINVLFRREDAYTRRLQAFTFSGEQDKFPVTFDGAFGWNLNRYFGVVGRYGMIEYQQLYKSRVNNFEQLQWVTRAVTLGVRGRLPLYNRWLVLFGDATAGIGFSKQRFTYEQVDGSSGNWTERTRNIALRGSVGIDCAFQHHFGIYAAGGYAYAPTLSNDLGDRRHGGTLMFQAGVRLNAVLGGW